MITKCIGINYKFVDRTCKFCGATFQFPSRLKQHMNSASHALFEANIKQLSEVPTLLESEVMEPDSEDNSMQLEFDGTVFANDCHEESERGVDCDDDYKASVSLDELNCEGKS